MIISVIIYILYKTIKLTIYKTIKLTIDVEYFNNILEIYFKN